MPETVGIDFSICEGVTIPLARGSKGGGDTNMITRLSTVTLMSFPHMSLPMAKPLYIL